MPDPVTIAMIGSAALQGLGGMFSANSASKSNQAQLLEQQRQFDLTRQDQSRRDRASASQMDPLLQQKSRGNMAMLAAILPGLRNFQVNAPAGMQKFVPQMSGGFRIPEGGFGQETLKFFSPESRASSEAEFLRTLGVDDATIARILKGGGYGDASVAATAPPPPPRRPGGPSGFGGPGGGGPRRDEAIGGMYNYPETAR